MYLDKNVCQTNKPLVGRVDIVTLEITNDIKYFSITIEVPAFVLPDTPHPARRTVCAGSEDDIQYSYKCNG